MLKTASIAGLTNKNLVQDGQETEVEDKGEKELKQKSYKGQKTAKSKKWIRAKKIEAFRAKNLSQLGMFLMADTKRAFTKL